MKTKELIAKLQELDPTGEKSVWVTDQYDEPQVYLLEENASDRASKGDILINY